MTFPTAAYRHSSSSYFDATVDVPGEEETGLLHTRRSPGYLNQCLSFSTWQNPKKLTIPQTCSAIWAQSTSDLLGSVGKMLMRRERREWTARRTLVLPHVMHAAMPRWRGLKWAKTAGGCSTVSRKQRISSPVQMLEMLAWAVCS